jgi:hypothetical protein
MFNDIKNIITVKRMDDTKHKPINNLSNIPILYKVLKYGYRQEGRLPDDASNDNVYLYINKYCPYIFKTYQDLKNFNRYEPKCKDSPNFSNILSYAESEDNYYFFEVQLCINKIYLKCDFQEIPNHTNDVDPCHVIKFFHRELSYQSFEIIEI